MEEEHTPEKQDSLLDAEHEIHLLDGKVHLIFFHSFTERVILIFLMIVLLVMYVCMYKGCS